MIRIDLLPGSPNFITQDEESSGVIAVDHIFTPGFYLLDVQSHRPTNEELVEDGQLLLMFVPPGKTLGKDQNK